MGNLVLSMPCSGYPLDARTIDIGEFMSEGARHIYEERIVEEARLIVAGEGCFRPKVEHLRVLLSWLDGPSPQLPLDLDGQPF